MKYKGRKGLSQDQIEGIEEGLQNLENFLDGRKWVAGEDVTIADFNLVANISSLDTIMYPVDGNKYPNIRTWLKNAEQLPFYDVNRSGLESFRKMFGPFLENL